MRGWTALRAQAGRAPSHLAEAADLKVETGYGTAKLGLSADSLPQLLLPVARGARRPRNVDAPLLRAVIEPLGDPDGSVRSYLVVTCPDRNLERAFADLSEAVLARVETGEGPLAAFTSAVQELRGLFLVPSLRLVDEHRIRGLVAELLLLDHLSRLHPDAVLLWFGPEKDRHDFRGGQSAIEVKSSARETSRVTISSIDQLTGPIEGTLHLRRYVLERTTSGPVTVESLFRSILDQGAPEQPVRERLAAMDCADPASDAWNHVSFNVEGSETYLVEEGFPRLTLASFSSGSLPSGVSDVVYEIDLSTAAHLRLDAAAEAALEEAFVSCLS